MRSVSEEGISFTICPKWFHRSGPCLHIVERETEKIPALLCLDDEIIRLLQWKAAHAKGNGTRLECEEVD